MVSESNMSSVQAHNISVYSSTGINKCGLQKLKKQENHQMFAIEKSSLVVKN